MTSRHRVVAGTVLAVLLVAIGGGIHAKSSQAVAPPVYDALSYYAKAAAVWRALGSGRLVNPLNVEPVVRPPGAVLLSGPIGFSPDFRWFFFRAAFVPVALLIGAYWLLMRERVADPTLVIGAGAALLSLPMFYHFERSDLLPVAASWGLVDPFLAGIAALATALLLIGARRRSLAWTAAGSLLTAFALLIKPSALAVIPAILLAWAIELAVLSRRVGTAWRRDPGVRDYAIRAGALVGAVVGLTALACFRSRYLSGETIRFFMNSQQILGAIYREVPLTHLIWSQAHPWIGWHWAALGAISAAWAGVQAMRHLFRRRLEAADVRFAGAAIAFGGGLAWWILLGGPSEMRYLLPFVLIAIVVALPDSLTRASTWTPWARRGVGAALCIPAICLIALLWADRPSPGLQRLLGVTLAAGQFREEVRIGRLVADAARAQHRELSVYAVEVDGAHGAVEAVGEYQRLLGPGRPVFRTLGPMDWQRQPLIRRHELLAADYVLFRPLAEAGAAPDDRVEGFDAETRAVRAWLSDVGPSDGFERVADGPLRLLRVADVAEADRSFDALLARHRWRPAFAAANAGSVTASRADVARVRAVAAPDAAGVAFGGRFVLHGAAVAPVDGGLQMELLWEALAAEPGNWWVFVHVLDGQQRITTQADYPLRASMQRGVVWHDRVVWSREQLRGARRIGIGIYQPPGTALPADRGDRDWNDTRVLIALP